MELTILKTGMTQDGICYDMRALQSVIDNWQDVPLLDDSGKRFGILTRPKIAHGKVTASLVLDKETVGDADQPAIVKASE